MEEKHTGNRSVRRISSEFFAGSIHEFSKEWMALMPNKLVSTTIAHGYSLPFVSTPSRAIYTGNRKSALEHCDFVDREIADLLATGAIREVPDSFESLHVHPLSVAKGPILFVQDGSSRSRNATGVPRRILNGTTSSMHLVLNAEDKRCTRAVAREVAKAQTEEWSHRKTWDKTQEESNISAQALQEPTPSLNPNLGKTDSFEVARPHKHSVWEYITLMLCALGGGSRSGDSSTI